mgnify:CR=1 FL=1
MPPRGGGDRIFEIPIWNLKSFNPRTHEECDLGVDRAVAVGRSFNPRTHEECDLGVDRAVAVGRSFNPRTHEECDPTLRR